MASRREIVVVIAVSILAMVPVVGLLATFNALSPSASIPSPGCSPPSANSTIPPNGSTEVLLPAGDVLPIAHFGSLVVKFTIDAPAELQGAWESSTPLGITVLGNLSGMYSMPPIPEYSLGGELNQSPWNVPLYPATWGIAAYPQGWWNGSEPVPAPVNLTVTQPIEVVFDRTLTILQRPADLNVSAGSYVCWPILLPEEAQDVWLAMPPLPATNDQYTVAIFPQSLFLQFQTNRSAISSSGVWEILQGVDGYPSGYWCLPLHGFSGDLLVFYNWASSGTTLTVPHPMEISYVAPALIAIACRPACRL
jgi:hypothetical protein